MINESRDDKEKVLREKLDFYISNQVMIHIELNDKKFLNGLVVEKVSDKVYIINERVLGLMHLFLSDVYRISKFIEVNK